MNYEEYAEYARIISAIPPDAAHPEGQRFRVGDVVKVTDHPKCGHTPAEMWKGRRCRVVASYYQQYGWMNGFQETDKNTYKLEDFKTGARSSWFDAEELEFVAEGS
jgi:hypothetical protein